MIVPAGTKVLKDDLTFVLDDDVSMKPNRRWWWMFWRKKCMIGKGRGTCTYEGMGTTIGHAMFNFTAEDIGDR